MSAAAVPAGARSVRGKPRLVAAAAVVEARAAEERPQPPAREEPLLLDVRGAAMAAQAGWTLAMLESLEIGRRVLHVNDVIPWSLFAMLVTRGIRYDVQSREDGDVRILMWRHLEADGAGHSEMCVERVRAL